LEKIIIVGLGNPGPEYEKTRHNLGFMFLDRLAGKFKKSRYCQFLYAEAREFVLVKPLTFMNKSGLAVKCIMDQMEADASRLLVVCDDFNLPLAKMRLRPGGSAGGHNGLKSIIGSIGTNEFPRLRLGIGGIDVEDKVDFVLRNFNKREFKLIDDMLIDARSIVQCYIENGIETTMNRFN
jgi:PTH1 family peptidyl-tRNA hydrolase